MSGVSTTIVVALAVLLGMATCVLGYRVFRAFLAVAGFTFGGLATSFIVMATIEGWTGVVVTAAGGVICAYALARSRRAGVFIAGALLGALIGGVQPTGAIGSLILALAGGFVAFRHPRTGTIVTTAFLGAWSAVAGIYVLAGGGSAIVAYKQLASLRDALQEGMLIIPWLLTGGAGAIVQHFLFCRAGASATLPIAPNPVTR